MYRISVDKTKCKQCGLCGTILVGFKYQWEDGMQINSQDIRQECLMDSARRTRDGCPNGAIVFEPVD